MPCALIVYDANGNTLSDPSGKSYTWDFENRLTQAAVPGTGTVAFKYDPFGRRIYKSSPTFTGIFAYDGANLIETMNSLGSEIASYTQDTVIDRPLAEFRSGTASYYQQDALNSVTSLSNSAGAVANTYSYDSFGKVTNFTGTLSNPFRYTGREWDAETGLYYYRARYFDPSAGRFLSEDPSDFGGGDVNFYAYTGNSPTNRIDPSGKAAGATPALGPAPGYCAANPVVCVGAIDGILLAYDSYEAYQLGVAYGWWGQPKPNQCHDDCGKLIAAIVAQMQIVQSRYAALMTDPLNLFNLAYSQPNLGPNAGTWLGHVDALATAQRGLQNRINAAKAKGCPIPPQAQFLAELPLPTKPGWQ